MGRQFPFVTMADATETDWPTSLSLIGTVNDYRKGKPIHFFDLTVSEIGVDA